jgi:hypothetical protein
VYQRSAVECRAAKRDEASMVSVCSSSRKHKLDDLSDQPGLVCLHQVRRMR